MHTEWIAATMGLVDASSARITLSRLGSCRAFGVPNSLISAPPEKALPAPVMTIDLTAGSSIALARPSVMPIRVEKPRPLTGGLVMVITATSPSTLYSAVMLRSFGMGEDRKNGFESHGTIDAAASALKKHECSFFVEF